MGALRDALACPRPLSLSVAGGERARAWWTLSPCPVPGPVQEATVIDSHIRGAGTLDIGSADMEHFPVRHRLAHGGGSEGRRSWTSGDMYPIGGQIPKQQAGKEAAGTLGKPKASLRR